MINSGVISISPQDAWQMLQDNPKAVLIDIRSELEYLFIGHPKGAIHIAWVDEPDWKVNPRFATEVRKVMLEGIISTDEPKVQPTEAAASAVILIDRSGRRSLEAGKKLVKEGFTKVYNVIGGFEGPIDAEHHRSTLGGWRYHGLPWEQC
jgi:rhodanese-related sulfurtransferase